MEMAPEISRLSVAARATARPAAFRQPFFASSVKATMSTSPYHAAGKLVDRVLNEHKGLKTVAFSGKSSTSKASYAQACETLRHKSLLDAILSHDGNKLRRAVQFDDTRSKGLLYVLLFELLFGKYKSIRGGGKLKRNVVKHAKELERVRDVVVKERAASGDGGVADSRAPTFPRYVRINTLKSTPQEVVDTLRKDLGGGSELEIYADEHVPDLLVLSPTITSRLYDHDLVKSGKIVLQDKSSCFSALVLVHGCGHNQTAGDYIDACAAPGNKTSHLAQLVSKQISASKDESTSLTTQSKKKRKKNNTPKAGIYAFDRSSARVKILKNRLGDIVPGNDDFAEMHPLHQDFLKADGTDDRFKSVSSILLDPSCSGSGIVNAPDRLADDGDSKDRIQSLCNFQLLALKHAMTSFPKVDRIVYSTCSLHEEENEQVVAAALKEVNGETSEDDDGKLWTLTKPACLEHWKRRGHVTAGLTKEQADCLIRADGLKGDNTNGFFVSYFERKRVAGPASGAVSAYKMPTIEGLEIYGGHFDVAVDKAPAASIKPTGKKSKGETKVADSADNNNKSKKRKATDEASGGDISSEGGSDTKKSKKALKKLAWKKKQMEQRARRLDDKKKQGKSK